MLRLLTDGEIHNVKVKLFNEGKNVGYNAINKEYGDLQRKLIELEAKLQIKISEGIDAVLERERTSYELKGYGHGFEDGFKEGFARSNFIHSLNLHKKGK